MKNKHFKSSKKSGYAKWLLTKVMNELTGDYFGNTAIEIPVKSLKRENARVSGGNAPCADKCDKAVVASRKP